MADVKPGFDPTGSAVKPSSSMAQAAVAGAVLVVSVIVTLVLFIIVLVRIRNVSNSDVTEEGTATTQALKTWIHDLNQPIPEGASERRTLAEHLSDVRNIIDYGADPDGVDDCTAAFNAIIAEGPGNVYIPHGTYLFMSKPNAIPNGTIMYGDGMFNTNLMRAYTPGAATDAFITIRNNCVFKNISVGATVGTDTGYAIEMISNDEVLGDWTSFQNVLVRGNGDGTTTWKRAISCDGQDRAADLGIRDLSFINIQVMDVTEYTIYIRKGVNVSLGGGVFEVAGDPPVVMVVDTVRALLHFHALAGSLYLVNVDNCSISGNVDTLINVDADSSNVVSTAGGAYSVTSACTSAMFIRPNSFALGGNTTLNMSVNGGTGFAITQSGSAPVNYLSARGRETSGMPSLEAGGADTNIDLVLTPKGTGLVRYGTYTADATAAINGYINIRDAAGTIRSIATVTPT